MINERAVKSWQPSDDVYVELVDHQLYVYIEGRYGRRLQIVNPNDEAEDIAALDAGGNPVADGWEDGNSQAVCYDNAAGPYPVCFAHNGRTYALVVDDTSGPNGEPDVWADIEAYDEDHGTDFWDHLEPGDIVAVGSDCEDIAATPVRSWDDVAYDGPEEITCTKTVAANGNGLMVSITKEARILGVDRGDVVEIVIRRKN